MNVKEHLPYREIRRHTCQLATRTLHFGFAMSVAALSMTCFGQTTSKPLSTEQAAATVFEPVMVAELPTASSNGSDLPDTGEAQLGANMPALLRPALPPAKPTWRSRLSFLQLEEITRFNYMDSAPHEVDARDMQYRIRARARFNLSASGSTYLETRAETGKGFNNSWDNTGIGKDSGQDIFNLKTFTLGQKLNALELEVGGIEFDQGSGTQHTYASGDGALVGYRARLVPSLKGDRSTRLDMTLGYVGNFDRQNVFSRLHLDRLNYYQALAQKQFGSRADASFELDSIQNVLFMRPAVHYHQLWRPLLDELTVESVLRTNYDTRFAWSATAVRPLNVKASWLASVIYSDIPYALYRKSGQLILANQGEIDAGKRISWGTNYSRDKKLDFGIFAGRRLDNTPSVRWVFQASIGYQYASLLNHLIH